MNKATWAMLNESEKALLRQAEGSSLAVLDEDELIDLHTRVRRARNKYATLYRRRASAQVREDAGRVKAHAQHARTAATAEAFEDALARSPIGVRSFVAALRTPLEELVRVLLLGGRRGDPCRRRAASRRSVRSAAARARAALASARDTRASASSNASAVAAVRAC